MGIGKLMNMVVSLLLASTFMFTSTAYSSECTLRVPMTTTYDKGRIQGAIEEASSTQGTSERRLTSNIDIKRIAMQLIGEGNDSVRSPLIRAYIGFIEAYRLWRQEETSRLFMLASGIGGLANKLDNYYETTNSLLEKAFGDKLPEDIRHKLAELKRYIENSKTALKSFNDNDIYGGALVDRAFDRMYRSNEALHGALLELSERRAGIRGAAEGYIDAETHKKINSWLRDNLKVADENRELERDLGLAGAMKIYIVKGLFKATGSMGHYGIRNMAIYLDETAYKRLGRDLVLHEAVELIQLAHFGFDKFVKSGMPDVSTPEQAIAWLQGVKGEISVNLKGEKSILEKLVDWLDISGPRDEVTRVLLAAHERSPEIKDTAYLNYAKYIRKKSLLPEWWYSDEMQVGVIGYLLYLSNRPDTEGNLNVQMGKEAGRDGATPYLRVSHKLLDGEKDSIKLEVSGNRGLQQFIERVCSIYTNQEIIIPKNSSFDAIADILLNAAWLPGKSTATAGNARPVRGAASGKLASGETVGNRSILSFLSDLPTVDFSTFRHAADGAVLFPASFFNFYLLSHEFVVGKNVPQNTPKRAATLARRLLDFGIITTTTIDSDLWYRCKIVLTPQQIEALPGDVKSYLGRDDMLVNFTPARIAYIKEEIEKVSIIGTEGKKLASGETVIKIEHATLMAKDGIQNPEGFKKLINQLLDNSVTAVVVAVIAERPEEINALRTALIPAEFDKLRERGVKFSILDASVIKDAKALYPDSINIREGFEVFSITANLKDYDKLITTINNRLVTTNEGV